MAENEQEVASIESVSGEEEATHSQNESNDPGSDLTDDSYQSAKETDCQHRHEENKSGESDLEGEEENEEKEKLKEPKSPPVLSVEPLTISQESDAEGGGHDEAMDLKEPVKMSHPAQFPLLNVSSVGTLSVILRHDIVVELNVDRSIRVACPGKFSAAISSHGSVSCIMHPQAKVLQEEKDIFTQFGSDKLAMLGTQGIMFTMRGLGQTFLVCDLLKGFTPIPSACVRFPTLSTDYTQKLFHCEDYYTFATPHRKSIAIQVCQDHCRSATYDIKADGTINVRINGVVIRQESNGDVEVTHRPRTIKASPSLKTVRVRTNFIEIGVEEEEKSFVKRGAKQIHVNKNGMVVSDGTNTTSMDQYGRILSPS